MPTHDRIIDVVTVSLSREHQQGSFDEFGLVENSCFVLVRNVHTRPSSR